MPWSEKTALASRLLGESVVVVIGILVALAIDQAVQDRAAASSEVEYLQELRSDFSRDMEWFDSFWLTLAERERGLSELASLLEKDSASAISASELGATVDRVFRLTSYPMTTTTFDDLVSTGNLKLMSDRVLRREVIDFYRWTDHWIRGSEGRRLDLLMHTVSDVQVALGHDYSGLGRISSGMPGADASNGESGQTASTDERANRIRRNVLALTPSAKAEVLDGLARLAIYAQWQRRIYENIYDRLLGVVEMLDRTLAAS